jgi:hypothetical protein
MSEDDGISPPVHLHIREAEHQIVTAQEHFKQGLKALSVALDQLAKCAAAQQHAAIDALPDPSDSAHHLPSTHRREHRFGRVPILDRDPVLRAFVLARLDGMTFEQIAEDVKAHFPEGQRVGKSAIHAWWQKNPV